VRDPGLHDLGGCAVIAKSFEEDLLASIELPAEYPMRTVGLVERAATILDSRAEISCRMLVLETLDSLALGARKEEANHHVVEAAIDEVVDDRSQLGLSAELFE